MVQIADGGTRRRKQLGSSSSDMARNLEDSLIQANADYVNFDRHREEYTTHYNALRDKLYTEWKAAGVLGKLLKGYTLGGGYGDNLKVSMPDEFDLVIHLVFPENDKIIVKADRAKPGNVILDMSKVMETILNQEHNKAVFELLRKIVNAKNELLEDKLQSWLQGVMTQALKRMGKQIEVGGVVSPLCYKKCGPAHTIFVKGRYEYSVDFVPAIKLSAAQTVLAPEQRRHFGNTPHWDAIPKPMKPAKNNNVSFRASYYDAERRLLHGKNNLKNAIRLLKQHRNTKNNMGNLKSYYIKTLFLWEVTRRDDSYWQKPLKELLIEMLGKLEGTLALSSGKGKLLFFWDAKLDMIADLSVNQRTEMFNCVSKSKYTFCRGDGNLSDDIKDNVKGSFSNGKDKGTENRPLNGQSKTANQDCKKKDEDSQKETKPKEKPTPVKPNEPKGVKVESPGAKLNAKPNDPKKTVEAKVQPTPVKQAEAAPSKPVAKPNEGQTGTKAKVKVEPVKPNPKPNEQKAAKVVTPPVQPTNQPKQNPPLKPKQPANNSNPNGNGAKPKTNVSGDGDSKAQQPPSEKPAGTFLTN
ncbi:cyclic GMP-AMP synthase-like receptor 1 [Drosophila gunungcola]|uniref:Uncharacterized protein n=1 Tax=Drosophila gunungcola TaxID=103775 RepID=A0A9P9YGF5_9MUSC|nr:cyclic GMP-AMP synthase-like receptor 1 [Drosophila gunungcola]KAI8036240.1 hypothetical protein M5D96_010833 [Drosophila gunungcola]